MILKTAASLLVLAWASGAAAQTTPASPAPEAGEASTVGEIIVTAQRRSERLVDVPISIATASSEDLERAGGSSLENLTKITPGIYLQRASHGLSPTVRGVGSTLPTSSGEQTVTVYVDEIYYPIPTGNVFDLASVAGVEVLKGPQGTLFGRNATGGAILIRTLDPTFTTQGRANISYERFDQVRASGYLNVPLGDYAAINGAVAYRKSGGYVRDLKTGDVTNEGDDFNVRAKLLLQPTDEASLVLTAAHARFDDPSGVDARSLRPARIIALAGGAPVATDRDHSSFNTAQYIRTRTTEISARAKLDIGVGTLSTFTAYIRNRLHTLNDLDGSYLNQNIELETRQNTFTHEVNLASPTDRPLSYIVGFYYYRSTGGTPFAIQNGAPLFFNRSFDAAISGYADGTYSLGDLSIIGGIRFTHEETRAQTGFGATEANGTPIRFQEASDDQWTPRVGLKYALGDETNIYATYSKGFKSGRFDRSSLTGPPVAAERLDAFEVGYKTASPNFTLSAAAFYYDYKDQQVNATVTLPSGGIITQLFNVPKAESYGVEVDALLRVSDSFDVRVAAAYTRARYKDFRFAPGYIDAPTNPTTLNGLLFANVSLDVSGKTMVRSPEFTASSTLRYHRPVGDDMELELTLSPYYSSRVYFTFDNSLSQKPYATLDAAATLSIGEQVKVSVFGRNLTDSKHALGKGQSALSLETVAFARPMTYGVSVGYAF